MKASTMASIGKLRRAKPKAPWGPVLTRQGKQAPGGAKNYIVNGKMTGGFAFVAYPAEYRSSGVMTFIVNADGVVYQKDLGKKTEAIGKAMKEYDRDPSWRKAEGAQDTTAGR